MLFIVILFYTFGTGLLIFGISIENTGYITHQTVKYIIFIMSILCMSTGSIILVLRKIFISLKEQSNNSELSKISTSLKELSDKINKNNDTIIRTENEQSLNTDSIKHKWSCPYCKKLINKYPCIFCGSDPEK